MLGDTPSGRTIVETERLVLREAVAADARFLLALLTSPGFIKNIGDRGVRDEAGAADYLRDRVLASYAQHGFGMWIVLERDGAAVGLAGLVRREGLDCPDVGYAFLPQVWGRGYAQEAAGAVMRHARETLGIGRLAAITSLDNAASMAVLRKVGFVPHGTILLPGVDEASTYFLSEGP